MIVCPELIQLSIRLAYRLSAEIWTSQPYQLTRTNIKEPVARLIVVARYVQPY
jgi:hypothetical protein